MTEIYLSTYRGTNKQVISISNSNNGGPPWGKIPAGTRLVFLSVMLFPSFKIPITWQCKRVVRKKLTCSYSPPLSRAAAILPSKSEELINSFQEEKLKIIMLGYEVYVLSI